MNTIISYERVQKEIVKRKVDKIKIILTEYHSYKEAFMERPSNGHYQKAKAASQLLLEHLEALQSMSLHQNILGRRKSHIEALINSLIQTATRTISMLEQRVPGRIVVEISIMLQKSGELIRSLEETTPRKAKIQEIPIRNEPPEKTI